MADILDLARIHKQHCLYDRGRLVVCTGNEENFFFDTTRLENGEYPVYRHDIGENDSVLFAQSFADFLRKRIRELYGIKG